MEKNPWRKTLQEKVAGAATCFCNTLPGRPSPRAGRGSGRTATGAGLRYFRACGQGRSAGLLEGRDPTHNRSAHPEPPMTDADPPPVDRTVLYVSDGTGRSEEHTSELQSRENLVCRLLLEKKKNHKLAAR